jgi:sugar-specific transcriptional regulator TrmB
MDKELLKTLGLAGFTEKETKVYLAFLELGKGTVYHATKLTDLKRPIVYVITEKLVEKGYLMIFPDKRATQYQAIDPVVILRKMQDSAKLFSEMLPIFTTLANSSGEKPKITYTKSEEGILNIYEKLNHYAEQFYISSYVRIEEKFPGIIDEWIKNYKRNKRRIIGRQLVPDNHQERALAKKFKNIGQEVRFIKNVEEMKMDLAVCGDVLAITSLAKNPFAVTIESTELASSLKLIFEIAWKSAKPL